MTRMIALLAAMLLALATPSLTISSASASELRPGAIASTAFVRAGPGNNFGVVGTLRGGDPAHVERCQGEYCYVVSHGEPGWVHRAYLNEDGMIDGRFFFGEHLDIPSGGPGRVCLFTGANYTGVAACFDHRDKVDDLAGIGYDNVFASILIEGRRSVQACSQPDQQSYCVLYVESTPTLGTYHDRGISSIEVF